MRPLPIRRVCAGNSHPMATAKIQHADGPGKSMDEIRPGEGICIKRWQLSFLIFSPGVLHHVDAAAVERGFAVREVNSQVRKNFASKPCASTWACCWELAVPAAQGLGVSAPKASSLHHAQTGLLRRRAKARRAGQAAAGEDVLLMKSVPCT